MGFVHGAVAGAAGGDLVTPRALDILLGLLGVALLIAAILWLT